MKQFRAQSILPRLSIPPAGLFLYILTFVACGTTPRPTPDPVKWVDPDNRSIPQPPAIDQNVIWDIVDHTFFYKVGQIFDLSHSARGVGNWVGAVPARQADNVNALDEVANSSWYTNRHFLDRMTLEELSRGPGKARPDTSGPLTIISGKFAGKAPGFTARDAAGTIFFLKFDGKDGPELATSAEVVSTKILHAAGYNVPRNSIFYLDPDKVKIGDDAQTLDAGSRRKMTRDDLARIRDLVQVEGDGRVRCVASRALDGIPLGVFDFHGRRRDDPNDRVRHNHRRELRGLRVIGSWINDVDRRAANTLNMYVTDSQERRYIKHYLIDMGATLGSSTTEPRAPKSGNEYKWDPGEIGRSLVGLGFYRKVSETTLPMEFSEVGYLESEVFSPARWVTNYPNPAFENCTNRDGYWGAKIVMSFTDEDIRSIVNTARFTNPDAAATLVRLLAERRDKVGAYWFTRGNPVDRFRVGGRALQFDDLAVDGGLASASGTTYSYEFHKMGGAVLTQDATVETRIPIPANLQPGKSYTCRIRTRRQGGNWSKRVDVTLHSQVPGEHKVISVWREE